MIVVKPTLCVSGRGLTVGSIPASGELCRRLYCAAQLKSSISPSLETVSERTDIGPESHERRPEAYAARQSYLHAHELRTKPGRGGSSVLEAGRSDASSV